MYLYLLTNLKFKNRSFIILERITQLMYQMFSNEVLTIFFMGKFIGHNHYNPLTITFNLTL